MAPKLLALPGGSTPPLQLPVWANNISEMCAQHEHGTVVIPAGTYHMHREIYIPSGCNITVSSDTMGSVHLSASATAGLFNVQGSLTLHGLILTSTTPTMSNSLVMALNSSSVLTVKNCTCKDVTSSVGGGNMSLTKCAHESVGILSKCSTFCNLEPVLFRMHTE